MGSPAAERNLECRFGAVLDDWARSGAECRWERSHSGSNRVIRGGSWNNDGNNLRAANRNNNTPSNRNNNIGFRCASSLCRPKGRLHGRGSCALRANSAVLPVPAMLDEEVVLGGRFAAVQHDAPPPTVITLCSQASSLKPRNERPPQTGRHIGRPLLNALSPSFLAPLRPPQTGRHIGRPLLSAPCPSFLAPRSSFLVPPSSDTLRHPPKPQIIPKHPKCAVIPSPTPAKCRQRFAAAPHRSGAIGQVSEKCS